MDKKIKKRSRLPRTSRVNDKIIEYYMHFGRDRDLERFMRLYSPANSQKSHRSCNSIDTLSSNSLRRLLSSGPSMSVPNIKINDGPVDEVTVPKETIIPIQLEETNKNDKEEKVTGISNINLSTPTKTGEGDTKQAETPTSMVISNRRLEWDSLGDVGYTKSMSTSNISTRERSILREIFLESSSSPLSHSSETDLKFLRKQLLGENKFKKKCGTEAQNTPPLASSTLVEPKLGAKPKKATSNLHTRSTSSTISSKKNLEKSAQTSSRYLGGVSQEVQVSMSSVPSSFVGSSVNPSSFEYFSSRSQSTTTSTDGTPANLLNRQRRQRQEAVVKSISDVILSENLLMQKSKTNTSSQSSSAQLTGNCISESTQWEQLHESLRRALSENKENSSAQTSGDCSTTLDLGIQLLCSLIDAKSLNSKEKKKLIRNIVKRISCLGSSTSTNSPFSKNSPKSKHGNGSSKKDVALKSGEGNMQSNNNSNQSQALTSNPEKDYDVRIHVYRKPSPLSTCTKPSTNAANVANIGDDEQTNAKQKSSKSAKGVVLNTASSTTEQKLYAAANSSEPATSSSTASKEVITTKRMQEVQEYSTDADQPTMSEWLNPMTHSEIEYEKKKRELLKNSEKRKEILSNKEVCQNDTERNVQINWIDTEIQRLESLRHLLLKDKPFEEPQPKCNEYNKSGAWINSGTDSVTKLYDTVCSEKSSVVGESTGNVSHEVEIIVEESNEDTLNAKNNMRRTREPKRETQIIYDKPANEKKCENLAHGRARFRAIKETIVTSEEQVLPKEEKPKAFAEKPVPPQRSKIDTPSGSNESESVCSFMQQRKREFAEHYKNKRKTHYESLKLQKRHQQQQQQQQQQKEQQLQLQERLRKRQPPTESQRPTIATTAVQTVDSHYSVVNTIQRCPLPNCHEQCVHLMPPCTTIPPLSVPQASSAPLNQHVPDEAIKATSACQTRAIYRSAAGFSAVRKEHQSGSSSSSMFCISSEISIPMGSNATSSTTTTHQYDDVAATGTGIAVQTGDSLKRLRPIHRPPHDYATNWHVPRVTGSCQSVCIQVKPKAVAYIVHFDSTSESETAIRSSASSNLIVTRTLSLQDCLERAKPSFLVHTKERKAILNKIQTLRQERTREMREIIDNTSFKSLDRKLKHLPPPPTEHLRVFPTKEMKAITNKRCESLPEVVEKKEREREERCRRSNRILRDVFNRRLQKRVRNGKLSLNHSRTVI